MQPARLAQAPALPSPDPLGNGVPFPGGEGKRRCRMHGGTNPGAPKGNRNARKHGAYSGRARAAARYLKAMALLVRDVDC